MNVRALAAEAIGTFILLTFGFLAVATVTIVTEGAGGFRLPCWSSPCLSGSA